MWIAAGGGKAPGSAEDVCGGIVRMQSDPLPVAKFLRDPDSCDVGKARRISTGTVASLNDNGKARRLKSKNVLSQNVLERIPSNTSSVATGQSSRPPSANILSPFNQCYEPKMASIGEYIARSHHHEVKPRQMSEKGGREDIASGKGPTTDLVPKVETNDLENNNVNPLPMLDAHKTFISLLDGATSLLQGTISHFTMEAIYKPEKN
jgi:hypothetical protein